MIVTKSPSDRVHYGKLHISENDFSILKDPRLYVFLIMLILLSVLLPGVFDGAWSLFLAMNQTEYDLEDSNDTLMEFTYENQKYADLLYKNLINLQFFGLSVS